MEAKLKALEEELDELRREVAICQLCGLISSKQGHAAKYREVMQSKSKQADYFRRLGKRERQTSIRSFITKESRRNEGGFDRPELVQQTISFQVTQTKKVVSSPARAESDSSMFSKMTHEEFMAIKQRNDAKWAGYVEEMQALLHAPQDHKVASPV